MQIFTKDGIFVIYEKKKIFPFFINIKIFKKHKIIEKIIKNLPFFLDSQTTLPKIINYPLFYIVKKSTIY